MKKTLKKLLAGLLAVLVIIGSSAVAFAGSITQAQAENIALKDIGISRTEAAFIRTEADYENGKLTEYEVDVYVKSSKGYTEYEYEIRVSDAKILSKKTETTSAVPSSGVDIGIAKAKENALEAFGLSADSVKLIKANKEKDKEWSSKLASQKKEFAISSALSKAGALENKAVLPFIDTGKVSLDENGNLLGFQEQVDAAKQNYGFLFKKDEPAEPQKPATHVVVSGNGTSEVPQDPSKMTLQQQNELYKSDPTRWTQLFRKKK